MPVAVLTRPALTAPAAAGFPTHDGLPRRWIAIAAAANVAVVLLLLAHARMTVDPLALTTLPYWLAAALLTGARMATRHASTRTARTAGEFAGHVGLFAAVTLAGTVASYPIAALSHGFADAALQRADEALGFDWLAWYRLVAAHPALQVSGAIAYESIFVTPAVLLAWFAWQEQRREAHRFIIGFWLAVVITLALFGGMAAVGPFSYLWHGPIPYMPRSGTWQADLIPLLRLHEAGTIDLGRLHGLVSAPSFHAASAVLFVAAAWRTPLRWPLLALNTLMLLATPVEGTHYLIDIILGALVALAAMAGADVIL